MADSNRVIKNHGGVALATVWADADVGGSHTQREPYPGQATGEIYATGNCDAGIDTVALLAGYQGPDGCEIAIKPEGGTRFKAWQDPAQITAITGLIPAVPADSWMAADPDTGTIYIMIHSSLPTGGLYSYNSDNGEVTQISSYSTGDMCAAGWVKKGRLFGISRNGTVYQFDTTSGAQDVFGHLGAGVTLGVPSSDGLRAAVSKSGEVMICYWGKTLASPDIKTYGSPDGVVWPAQARRTWPNASNGMISGSDLELVAAPEYGFILMFGQLAGAKLVSVRVPLYSSDPAQSSIVTTGLTGGMTNIAACTDETGVTWAVKNAATTTIPTYTAYSTDGGASWSPAEYWIDKRAGGSYLPLALASGRGCLAMLAVPEDGGTVTTKGAVLRLGGWSTATFEVDEISGAYSQSRAPFSFGGAAAYSRLRHQWLPVTLPENGGTTYTNTGGSRTLVAGSLSVITSTAGHYVRHDETGIPKGEITVFAMVEMVGTGTAAGNDCALIIHQELASGVFHRATIRLSNNGGTVTIADAASGATHTWNGAGGNTLGLIAQMSLSGRLSLYIRDGDGAEFSRVLDDEPMASFPTTGLSWYRWGHPAPNSSGFIRTEWHYVGHTQDYAARFSEDKSEPYPFSRSAKLPKMVPDLGGGGTIRARSTVQLGAASQIPIAYKYPVSSCVFGETKSSMWRSQAKATAQIIELTLSQPTEIYGVLAVTLVGANFRTAFVEYYDGTSWVILGSVDMGVAVGGWLRNGATIRSTENISISPADPARRHLFKNEFEGGYFEGDTFIEAYRIKAQTAGKWDSPHTPAAGFGPRAKPNATRLYLDGDLSAESTTGAGGFIVAKTGTLLIPVVNGTDFVPIVTSQLRLRIPASQVTPDDYYQLQALHIGQLYQWGAAPDWGMQRTAKAARTVARNRFGGIVNISKDAPQRQQWTVGWSGGMPQSSIEEGSSYLSPAVGLHSTGIPEDVSGFLEGVSDRATTKPVTAVWVVPAIVSPTMLVGTRQVLYGWLHPDGGTDTTEFLGEQGSGEVLRVASITIEEIA